MLIALRQMTKAFAVCSPWRKSKSEPDPALSHFIGARKSGTAKPVGDPQSDGLRLAVERVDAA